MEGAKRSRRGERELTAFQVMLQKLKKGPCLHATFVLIQGACKQIDLCFSLCGKNQVTFQ